jgi:RNA polymerase sigma factor (sigma-70 family)
VVRDHAAAEDAFQATFLVLVCKARTIRGREAIGGWLHRVAYRTAIQASADAARQRVRERPVSDRPVPVQSRDDASNDWRHVLHEEIARLSEKYRLPVLLCDLEGKTHTQAAAELKCGEATVRRRRARAHDLLRSRLARRGVGFSVAGVAASFGRSDGAGLSSTCIQATVKAAAQISTTAMRIGIADVISTTASSLARKSLRAMLLGELKTLASAVMVFCVLGCIAWGVAAPGQAKGRGDVSRPIAYSVPAAVPDEPKADRRNDPKETTTYRGRVVDPDGRPFQGAALYLNSSELKQPDKLPVRAISGTDGRFRFAVSRADFNTSQDGAPWSSTTIFACANGYALGFAIDRGDDDELILELQPDDVPISGRIIDTEGRPVAGVILNVLNVRSTIVGSLDDWLKALDARKELYSLEYKFPNRLERQSIASIIPAAVTDADGAFRIQGIGRERVAALQVEGPTIETRRFEVRTRPGMPIRVRGDKGSIGSEPVTIYGARFEHVAGRTRPIEGVVRDQETGKPVAGIMIRPEQSPAGTPIAYIHSITDAHGHYRLVGSPFGREGHILAVPPRDFRAQGSLDAEFNAPPREETAYLPVRVTAAETHEFGPLHLDVQMKRGVWVRGRVIDRATGKPVPARVDYFVYRDNPALQAFPRSQLPANNYLFVPKDGTFEFVAFPGSGLLAARALDVGYVAGAGFETTKHKLENGHFDADPFQAVPTNYHVLAEIDPAKGTQSLTRDLLLEAGRSLTVVALGPDDDVVTDLKVSGLRNIACWDTLPSKESTQQFVSYMRRRGRAISGVVMSTSTTLSSTPGKARTLTFLSEERKLIGQLALRGDETDLQWVNLEPWGAIAGRVVNADGEPTGGYQINGIDLPGGDPHVGRDGRFGIEGLIPNKAYDLRLLSGGSRLEGLIAKDLKVGPGETIDLHDVVPKNEGKK